MFTAFLTGLFLASVGLLALMMMVPKNKNQNPSRAKGAAVVAVGVVLLIAGGLLWTA